MRLFVCFGLAVSVLAGCGRYDAPPAIVRPTPQPTVEAVESAAPVVEAAQAPTPPDQAPQETANLPQLVELAHERVDVGRGLRRLVYDRVAYPAPLQRALERELLSVVPTVEGFEFFQCNVTLATQALVSYACFAHYTMRDGEGAQTAASMHAFEVSGTQPHALRLDDLLVRGNSYQRSRPMSLTATGLRFLNPSGEGEDATFEALGALLNPRSALRRIPQAVQAATQETPLYLSNRPPESIRVTTSALPFARALQQASRLHATWLFAETEAPPDVSTPLLMDVLHAPTEAATTHAWTTPLQLVALRMRGSHALHATQGGAASGAMLLDHTMLIGALGDLQSGLSSLEHHRWVLVSTNDGELGWLPSHAVEALPLERGLGFDVATDSAVNAWPEAARESARAHVRTLGVAPGPLRGFAAYATVGDETALALALETQSYVWPRHRGAIAALSVVQVCASRWTDPLLLVAWLLPDDPDHHHWEAYWVQAQMGAPDFEITLPLPTAPGARRATVVTGMERASHYYPFVVRGPGRREARYRWDGTTLSTDVPAYDPDVEIENDRRCEESL